MMWGKLVIKCPQKLREDLWNPQGPRLLYWQSVICIECLKSLWEWEHFNFCSLLSEGIGSLKIMKCYNEKALLNYVRSISLWNILFIDCNILLDKFNILLDNFISVFSGMLLLCGLGVSIFWLLKMLNYCKIIIITIMFNYQTVLVQITCTCTHFDAFHFYKCCPLPHNFANNCHWTVAG